MPETSFHLTEYERRSLVEHLSTDHGEGMVGVSDEALADRHAELHGGFGNLPGLWQRGLSEKEILAIRATRRLGDHRERIETEEKLRRGRELVKTLGPPDVESVLAAAARPVTTSEVAEGLKAILIERHGEENFRWQCTVENADAAKLLDRVLKDGRVKRAKGKEWAKVLRRRDDRSWYWATEEKLAEFAAEKDRLASSQKAAEDRVDRLAAAVYRVRPDATVRFSWNLEKETGSVVVDLDTFEALVNGEMA